MAKIKVQLLTCLRFHSIESALLRPSRSKKIVGNVDHDRTKWKDGEVSDARKLEVPKGKSGKGEKKGEEGETRPVVKTKGAWGGWLTFTRVHVVH